MSKQSEHLLSSWNENFILKWLKNRKWWNNFAIAKKTIKIIQSKYITINIDINYCETRIKKCMLTYIMYKNKHRSRKVKIKQCLWHNFYLK